MRDSDLSTAELLKHCREKCFDFVWVCFQGLVDIGDLLNWETFTRGV